MNIFGQGIDLVDVEYFRRLCEDGAEDVLDRYFTVDELTHASAGPNKAESLAGRFAAKEAVLKALGLGWTHDIAWTDVEISALPSGAPVVSLHARCSELASARGVTSWLVSISHTSAMAVASALALVGPAPLEDANIIPADDESKGPEGD